MRALTLGSMAARSFARTVPTTSSCATRATGSTTTVCTEALGSDARAGGVSCFLQPPANAAITTAAANVRRAVYLWREGIISGIERGAGSRFGSGARATTAAPADAEFEEDAFEGTEAGEGGLKKVEADECGEKQPALVDPIPEGEAGEHERSGDEVDDALDVHNEALG